MLNKKVSDLLNEQINKELYSGYLYLDMNNYFDKRGRPWRNATMPCLSTSTCRTTTAPSC